MATVMALAALLGGCVQPPTRSSAPPSATRLLAMDPAASADGQRPADDGAGGGDEASDWPLSGFLSTRWEHRREGGDHADDMTVLLGLDGGDATRDGVTFHLDGRYRKGFDSSDREGIFKGLNDTYNGSNQWSLYTAWVDLHDVPALERLRVGRQTDFETPVPLVYDGVHVRGREFGELRARIGTYGGLSHYEYTEGSRRDDALYGLYADMRPWKGGRLRMDWVHSDDGRTVDDLEDDLLGLHVWQDLRPLRLEGAWTALESHSRDVRFVSSWIDAERELTVRASYYELLKRQGQHALEFDPLSSSLFDLFPFRELELTASKTFDGDLTLLGGLARRDVDDSADEGEYNRDVDRLYVTATVHELVTEANSLGVTATRWDSDGRDQTSWGADLSHELAEGLEASVGTYYWLYKTSVLTGTERDDVRVYYVRFDSDLTEGVSTDLTYELEDSDIGRFHIMRARVTWRF